jgi:hypothetical protein
MNFFEGQWRFDRAIIGLAQVFWCNYEASGFNAIWRI